MKIHKTLVVLCGIPVITFCYGQDKPSAKKEIRKDAKEVAAGARQVWHGVKEGGREAGHQVKHVTKKIGKGASKAAHDVKHELKK
jgi:hypothetical protein